ncbi:WD40-repeat-containing domain protein [Polychytrium aggregatum]|uniref:WD40-repeat-containing domain protein n=1 Tax=Polychytrium aggregatum TaxID=110093 RepID=UPI0022FE6E69|nr:WD40-repeat-containing domain protein [Polychytrium aggregatum]KAI9202147.1 WD40-repeat-containing domain protein [Polychytrium aggregatum]
MSHQSRTARSRGQNQVQSQSRSQSLSQVAGQSYSQSQSQSQSQNRYDLLSEAPLPSEEDTDVGSMASNKLSSVSSSMRSQLASTTQSPPNHAHGGPRIGFPGGDHFAHSEHHSHESLRYHLGSSLTALAANSEKNHVVVVGKNVIKILGVAGSSITEYMNLRVGFQSSQTFQCSDVQWGRGELSSTIVAATMSNSILAWDIQRTSPIKFDRSIADFDQVVNRLSFHPTQNRLLLCGSQDGIIRLLDLRERSSHATAFEGRAEGVRDVQFSPVNGHEFAAAFESGIIQKWDLRHQSAWVKKWAAHNAVTLSLDWHHSGKYLASGGRDKIIKVWDATGDARKPVASIQATMPVSRVQWRPGYDWQLASCYLNTDNRINIWDLGRPFIPYCSIEKPDNTTTGLLWANEDTMWTCSKEQYFFRFNIDKCSARPFDQMSRVGIAWSPDNTLAFAADQHEAHEQSIAYYRHKPSAPTIQPQRPGSDVDPPQIQVYHPQQLSGYIERFGFDFGNFSLFAESYRLDSDPDKLYETCGQNAMISAKVGQRTACQTWRMLQLLIADHAAGEASRSRGRNLTALLGAVHDIDESDEPHNPLGDPMQQDPFYTHEDSSVAWLPLPQDKLSRHIGNTDSEENSEEEPYEPRERHEHDQDDGGDEYDAGPLPSDPESGSPLGNADYPKDASRQRRKAGSPRHDGSKHRVHERDSDNDDDDGGYEEDRDESDEGEGAENDSLYDGKRIPIPRSDLAAGIAESSTPNTTRLAFGDHFDVGTLPSSLRATPLHSRPTSASKARTKHSRSRDRPRSAGRGRRTPSPVTDEPLLRRSGTAKSSSKPAIPEFIIPEWDWKDYLEGVLTYYSNLGNVQMCVALSFVMEQVVEIDQERLKRWVWAYIGNASALPSQQ